MKKTIIFDWSGVISDDRLPVYESNMILLEKYGRKKISFEEWLPQTKLNVIEYLADYGITVSPNKIAEEYRQALNKVRRNGIHPVIYKDTPLVLEKLSKKVKLAVLSSHPEKNLKDEAREYNVSEYFDTFIGDVKDKNTGIPDLLKSLGINNNDTSYIGDTIYDIRAAKAAKVFSIGITTGYHLKKRLQKENPDLIIDSLGELLKYV